MVHGAVIPLVHMRVTVGVTMLGQMFFGQRQTALQVFDLLPELFKLPLVRTHARRQFRAGLHGVRLRGLEGGIAIHADRRYFAQLC